MTAQVKTRAGHLPYQRGSEWRKWDLHVHTPDTAREDGYTGWPSFLQALKTTKDVSVVGVTDYVSIANYEQLIRHKKDAKLGSIDLLIPNIEFRVTPQTDRGHAVNLHLLTDPTDPAHCDEINHALARLSIEYQRQPYSCTRAGITKLGAAYNHDLADDDARYREGVNQFKVDFAVFWKWYENEAWLRQHSLVCAAGGNDGPSGIKDSGWAAKQEEIWRSANIIFSANQNNRAFWLAEGGDKSDGAKKLGAPKPCFHGSDAHCLDDLFKPSPNGFCWIKGDPTFEGLRQTLYEPKERVYIGNHPPARHDASRVISEIAIGGGGTAAFRNLKLGLNSGLVTIIGQKGSGKSALTDLLAYAAGKDSSADSDSFISRAAEYLSGTAVTLTWLDGHTSKAVIGDKKQRRADVRYLSQSFVEKLCSDDYVGTELTNEIERVIFSNLDPTDTLNTSSFTELRGVRTQVLAAERVKLTSKIRELIAEDETLREAAKAVPAKKDRIEALGKEQTGLKKQLPSAETPEEAEAQKQLPILRQELQKLQSTVASLKQRQLKLQQLRSKLDQFKAEFEASRQDFLAQAKDLGVAKKFDLDLKIKGEDALDDLGADLMLQISQLEGKATPTTKNGQERTIKTVAKQIEEIEKRVASDQTRRSQIQQIQKRVASIAQEIARLQKEIMTVEGGNVARQKTIRQTRLDIYEKLFQSWKKEQAVLEGLYEPVRSKLQQGLKEEKMLDFHINWDVDLENWLERGNDLFDQRKGHPFGSPLKFREAVQSSVLPGWETGDPPQIKAGMEQLLEMFKKNSVETHLRARVKHSDLLEWVFGYAHIKLSYGLRYNGTELDKLSPGTKGIVLLILYLAMDSEDSMPLVVDQPEENLDSESIYSLLSHYFRSAKLLRQVIVITHNPNLVVNTDSDQVIVASADRLSGAFPTFSYESGGLEDNGIRDKVCLILEGGEAAFLKREVRYGIKPS
jgi:energy-coupling factor transporter ATP-binding protein EcfA2